MIIIPGRKQIKSYSFKKKKDDQVIVSGQKIQQISHSHCKIISSGTETYRHFSGQHQYHAQQRAKDLPQH